MWDFIEHLQHFYKFYGYFDFIIFNAKNVTSRKYVLQNGEQIFKTISEFTENSALIASQNSFKDRYNSNSFHFNCFELIFGHYPL